MNRELHALVIDDEQDLAEHVRNHRRATGVQTALGESSVERPPEEWPPLSEVEGRYVARVLAHTKGNKQAAARVLGVDRKTLGRMIKRHGIEPNNLVREVSVKTTTGS
jgi:DNA-binding NtrC family response regulator